MFAPTITLITSSMAERQLRTDEEIEEEAKNMIDDDDADTGELEKNYGASPSNLARKILSKAVAKYSGRNWRLISECLSEYGRTDVQCLHRWQKVLRPGLVKGPWTDEEDQCVVNLVNKFGVKSWSFIARQLKGRLGKQCRERWYNHLNPAINKEPWTNEEDNIITTEHSVNGKKWAEIAKLLPGRTDNAIKNRWNSTLQRLMLHGTDDTPRKSRPTKTAEERSVSKTKRSKKSPEEDVGAEAAEDRDGDGTAKELATSFEAAMLSASKKRPPRKKPVPQFASDEQRSAQDLLLMRGPSSMVSPSILLSARRYRRKKSIGGLPVPDGLDSALTLEQGVEMMISLQQPPSAMASPSILLQNRNKRRRSAGLPTPMAFSSPMVSENSVLPAWSAAPSAGSRPFPPSSSIPRPPNTAPGSRRKRRLSAEDMGSTSTEAGEETEPGSLKAGSQEEQTSHMELHEQTHQILMKMKSSLDTNLN